MARRSSSRTRLRPPRLSQELARFLVVGGAGFVVDVGLFTLLRLGSLGLLEDKPLTAKVLSAAAATVVTWLGNRWWTWGHRSTSSTRRELLLFVAMNLVGTGIALLCLGVSHYLLDLRGVVADNVAANGVGLVLGTAFRFVAYRTVVFRDAPVRAVEPDDVPPADDLLVPAEAVERARRRRAGAATGRTPAPGGAAPSHERSA